jgi:hypothetical protein
MTHIEWAACREPRVRLIRLTLLVLGFAGFVTPHAAAKPRSIGFSRMVDAAQVVAVARFAEEWHPDQKDRHVDLQLIRILKGDLKAGTYRVSYDDIPDVSADAPEFVAFLGPGHCWRFAAQSISAKTQSADSVLAVTGFHDSNAYLVSPGLVTLRQIEQFISDHILRYTIRGRLYFPRRGETTWHPSSFEIEIAYDARTAMAVVHGLPELKGFRKHPRVSVGSVWADTGVLIQYSRDSEAPLEIHGQVQSLDPKTQVMHAKFYVTEPDVLSVEEFREYVSDPSKGHSYYTVKLSCRPAPGHEKPWTMTLTARREIGRMAVLDGWADTSLRIEEISSSGDTLEAKGKLSTGEELLLRFKNPRADGGHDTFHWSFQEWLLYRLLAGDMPGTVSKGERELASFTASLGEVRYVNLEMPRTERLWLRAADAVDLRPEAEMEGSEPFSCGRSVEQLTDTDADIANLTQEHTRVLGWLMTGFVAGLLAAFTVLASGRARAALLALTARLKGSPGGTQRPEISSSDGPPGEPSDDAEPRRG